MPTPPVNLERVHDVLTRYAAMRAHDPSLTSEQAAAVLGMGGSTLREWVRRYGSMVPPPRSEVSIGRPPPEAADEPIEDLLARKKEHIKRAKAQEAWGKLIPVSINSDKPIAVTLVGDPHIDDDHCDIETLEADLDAVSRTQGMFAGHIGDLTNNWVGRLAKLYAHQRTTFDEGVRLTEWMLKRCPTLFLVAGNHDMWNNGMDILRFITKQAGVGHTRPHGARLALRWPNGEEIRIHARHDFRGGSIYSDTHGHKRALLWGHKDHVLVAGHKHVDEARVEPSIDGMAHWMFRVSGYKVIDDFAEENGFVPKRMAPSVTVVLDPYQRVPAERVKPYWDIDNAAEYLTWLRKKTRR